MGLILLGLVLLLAVVITAIAVAAVRHRPDADDPAEIINARIARQRTSLENEPEHPAIIESAMRER